MFSLRFATPPEWVIILTFPPFVNPSAQAIEGVPFTEPDPHSRHVPLCSIAGWVAPAAYEIRPLLAHPRYWDFSSLSYQGPVAVWTAPPLYRLNTSLLRRTRLFDSGLDRTSITPFPVVKFQLRSGPKGCLSKNFLTMTTENLGGRTPDTRRTTTTRQSLVTVPEYMKLLKPEVLIVRESDGKATNYPKPFIIKRYGKPRPNDAENLFDGTPDTSQGTTRVFDTLEWPAPAPQCGNTQNYMIQETPVRLGLGPWNMIPVVLLPTPETYETRRVGNLGRRSSLDSTWCPSAGRQLASGSGGFDRGSRIPIGRFTQQRIQIPQDQDLLILHTCSPDSSCSSPRRMRGFVVRQRGSANEGERRAREILSKSWPVLIEEEMDLDRAELPRIWTPRGVRRGTRRPHAEARDAHRAKISQNCGSCGEEGSTIESTGAQRRNSEGGWLLGAAESIRVARRGVGGPVKSSPVQRRYAAQTNVPPPRRAAVEKVPVRQGHHRARKRKILRRRVRSAAHRSTQAARGLGMAAGCGEGTGMETARPVLMLRIRRTDVREASWALQARSLGGTWGFVGGGGRLWGFTAAEGR
ncbi:hypothetical protein DFH09DRAFT_1103040 [Mycena vulgaris]|nr:hypothetical protein DFH09DRAFT_1103040 [Mycena vulgaris]